MKAAIFQNTFTTNQINPNITQFRTNNNELSIRELAQLTNIFVAGNLSANSIIVTQTVQVSGQYIYPLVAGTGITFTTNNIGTGQTNLTIASSSSGDTTATNIVTLTQTGTNGSQLDFSLVARGGLFKISLTNNCYFSTPANVANTPFTKAYLAVLQPSTGTCLVTWTNGTFAWPEQVQPINDTNANAVVWYEFRSSPFSNNVVDGWMSLKSLR